MPWLAFVYAHEASEWTLYCEPGCPHGSINWCHFSRQLGRPQLVWRVESSTYVYDSCGETDVAGVGGVD